MFEETGKGSKWTILDAPVEQADFRGKQVFHKSG